MSTQTTNLIMRWTDIAPKDAKGLDLSRDLNIAAPLNENGERCPWPWEPQQLVDAPLGQYHCGYCGAMVMAGMPHIDYAPETRMVTPENLATIFEWCEPSKLRTGPGPDGRLVTIGLTLLVNGQRMPALFGDTITRHDDGTFTVSPATAGTADA